MCTLMDLPQTEREKFLQWNLDTLGAADFTSPTALKAWGEMDAYWRNIVKDRRNRGTKDLISQILDAQLEGENLADEEVSGFCSLLHDASQNTTMNMITNAIIVLSRYPDQRRKLKANPALWSTALEELLRFVSPVQGLARMTMRDVELARRHDESGRSGPAALRVGQPRRDRLREPRRARPRAPDQDQLDVRSRHSLLPRQRGRPSRNPRRHPSVARHHR
jgi:cytochrome P450